MSGKLFGYARVSTDAQNLNRQIDILKQNGVEEQNIFTDKITGVAKQREAFDKLKSQLRKGDTVVVESLSRLSRSTQDLLNILEEWDKEGITFISLKESIDFSSATGKLLLTFLAAIADFERNMIKERVQEGLRAARNRGIKGGRPRVDGKKLSQAIKLHESGEYTISEITEVTGISSSTLYRALKDKKEEQE